MNPFISQNPAASLRLSLACVGLSHRLAPNFTAVEFASRDGADEMLVHPALLLGLQAIRETAGVPVGINSGYRSPAHNKAVKGHPNSYHTQGMAADIVIRGWTPAKMRDLAKRIGFGGVGIYKNFVHVDVGPRNYFTGGY